MTDRNFQSCDLCDKVDHVDHQIHMSVHNYVTGSRDQYQLCAVHAETMRERALIEWDVRNPAP